MRTTPRFLALTALLVACGGDSTETEPDVQLDAADTTAADATSDVDSDAGDDVTEDTVDDAEDTSDDTQDDTVEADTASDVEGSGDTSDAGPRFTDWDHTTAWEPPALEWSTCDVEPDGTLAAKAAYYDWIVPAIHDVPPGTEGHEDWSRLFGVTCDGPVPTEIVPDEDLPTCTHNLSENNGLWTGLYVASQAYRYAATGDEEALTQVLRSLRATHRMMRITGSPGLFTRDFRDPSLPQQYCPTAPEEYAPPDENMIGNRWVRVGDDGCFITWDPDAADGAGDWYTHEDHCTSTEFAGYCWQRNVSKDEYSGHYYAASIVAKVVDNEEAQELAATILTDATHHLIDNEFWLTDYDGRETRFGSSFPLSFDHVPGFNALQALSWMRAAASVTHAPEFEDMYYGCMLAEYEPMDCIDRQFEKGDDFRDFLGEYALKVNCQINFDNVSIMSLVYTGLMLMEPDPELRTLYRDEFHRGSRGDGGTHDIWVQGNAHLNFTLAAMMESDPTSPEDALTLVHDGVCALHEFRSDNVRRTVDNSDVESICTSDRHGPLAAAPLPLAERCTHVYEWWGNPLQIENCTENLNKAEPPAGYLLPYWMGRYYGFISPEM